MGLIIDKNLNWNEHINTNATKVLNCANAFLRVARNTWGLSAEDMRTIYIGAIEPMLLYGVSVWGNAITKKYVIDKLRRVQRIFAIKAIKGYRTISYDAAVVIANLIPIELRIKELINIYKLKNSSDDIIESLHADLLQRPINTDMLHPAIRPQITVTTEINTETNDIEFYTYGSKTNTNVGAGFTVMHNSMEIYNDRLRLAEYCSVFQSELIAILYSLIWITKNINQYQQIIIKSDSKSGISAISNTQTHNPIIHKIHTLIQQLETSGIAITFQWIRGHSGIYGNERADELAKEGSRLPNTDAIYNYYPLSYAKRNFREQSLIAWSNQWATTTKGTITHAYFPTIESRTTNRHFKPEYKLTQFISGHGNGHSSALFEMRHTYHRAATNGDRIATSRNNTITTISCQRQITVHRF